MRASIAPLLALSLLLASCSRHRDDAERAELAASQGDVRILTSGGELDLAIVGDTISAGLAPAALEKARQATDTARVNGTGLGGSIERMVKTTVQGAIASRVSFPVSAVKDVRYREGTIEFEWQGRPPMLLDKTKVNGKPFLASFDPDDAERFVAAVRGRIRPAQ